MHKCHQSLENILGKSVPSGSLEQDRHPFSVKGQVVNVLGFAGRTVSCIFFCFIFYFFPQPLRNVMLILSSQAMWKQAAGGFGGGPVLPSFAGQGLARAGWPRSLLPWATVLPSLTCTEVTGHLRWVTKGVSSRPLSPGLRLTQRSLCACLLWAGQN